MTAELQCSSLHLFPWLLCIRTNAETIKNIGTVNETKQPGEDLLLQSLTAIGFLVDFHQSCDREMHRCGRELPFRSAHFCWFVDSRFKCATEEWMQEFSSVGVRLSWQWTLVDCIGLYCQYSYQVRTLPVDIAPRRMSNSEDELKLSSSSRHPLGHR